MCHNVRVSSYRVVTTPLDAQCVEQVVATVESGELLVTPTDTVYGIGATVSDPCAVERLLQAKGRGRQMPPPVVASKTADFDSVIVGDSPCMRVLADAFWPGALTIVVPAVAEVACCLGDLSSVAIRVPDHGEFRRVLSLTGPLALTSANETGEPAATTCQQAIDYFGDRVGTYIDDGPSQGGVASTIVDLTGPSPRILREGGISRLQICDVLKEAGLLVQGALL